MIAKKLFKMNDTVEVTFEVRRPGAREVALLSESQQWEPLPMRAVKRSEGIFRSKLVLRVGEETAFRYLIDQESWENDEGADGFRPNPFGSEDSVVRALVS